MDLLSGKPTEWDTTVLGSFKINTSMCQGGRTVFQNPETALADRHRKGSRNVTHEWCYLHIPICIHMFDRCHLYTAAPVTSVTSKIKQTWPLDSFLDECTSAQCGILLERLVKERNCSPKGLGFGRGGVEGSTIPPIHTLEKWRRKWLSGRNVQRA